MKAFIVFCGDPMEGCILVYAESANKARSKSYNLLFCWDYIDTSAKRRPDFDQYYREGTSVIECNSFLPDDAPDFYDDDIEL